MQSLVMELDKYIVESENFSGDKSKAIITISAIFPECESFKIGKTGEALRDRLDQYDYKEEYKFKHIAPVYKTKSKSLASKMEAELIDCFSNHDKCENIKDGDKSLKDKMADADTYYVYVVWK